jgi:predicted alternative tryptophan synthase beta-subunit
MDFFSASVIFGASPGPEATTAIATRKAPAKNAATTGRRFVICRTWCGKGNLVCQDEERGFGKCTKERATSRVRKMKR